VTGQEPGPVASVTFDDGIASAVEHGLPVLEEVGAPGTMFLTLLMLGWCGWTIARARLEGCWVTAFRV
jgi:peptidoglycan/xylan/chitin deacetylase (PgdA/CDA1 family)